MNSPTDSTPALRQGLSGYLRAVAEEVGVPREGTSFEVSDTATAYLALAGRWHERADQDLMLVWSERHGWVLAVETDPAEPALVVDYLGGNDLVPTPAEVGRFVTEVVAGLRRHQGDRPVFPIVDTRHDLAERLAAYVIWDE
ncbi:DUF6292 family protein [Amycolatopsis palatopharyngis]|uniref:DUF6292 family protein n=1 Tax=Amycolatopsis palatopharyngis TaxID=187982 RepID=UPI000E2547A6|nr:DUF6292 family protein [Amycolatopsis palatopharyngis]